MAEFDEFLDTPGYGAAWVAAVLNLRKEDGGLDIGRAYYLLEKGYVDADKIGRGRVSKDDEGRIWTSTRRRLLKNHLATSEKASC